MKANDQDVFVYPTPEPHIATFGANGLVKVEIKYHKVNVESVEVRPLTKKHPYTFDRDGVTVWLNPLDQVSIEINGDLDNPLFVFVNPLEENKPNPDDENVRYFKAGEVYNVGGTRFTDDNTSVYIEGGAVVEGCIVFQKSDNVSIGGYGILRSPKDTGSSLRFESCTNVKVDGIFHENYDGWSIAFLCNKDVDVNNYKVVAPYGLPPYGVNNGGLNILATENAVVKNSWAYAHDDAFMVKSQKFSWIGETKNVYFENCIGWNVEAGNSFEIGYETEQNVSDIHFKDIYSIHSEVGPRGVMRRAAVSIHQAAGGTISNVTYENVYIEDPMEHGIYLSILKAGYSIGDGVEWKPGVIDGVSFKNVYFYKDAPEGNLILYGTDRDVHTVKNLSFENFYIKGVKINSLKEAGCKVDHRVSAAVEVPAENVTFK
ncbi:MAG: hypothetical protein IKD05_03530 [Tidjanibacter sp.]|nr:hypothetical protein [Tidjanibacter sp.]MBR7129328.1 hypothetical protein [Tidjanibacter sp.]